MIPILLDCMTVFFLVAGCLLLWWNLRTSPDVIITPVREPALRTRSRDIPMPSLSLPRDPHRSRGPNLTQGHSDNLAMLIDEALSSRPAQIVNSHLWQPAAEPAQEAEGLATRVAGAFGRRQRGEPDGRIEGAA
jgi:hypothetical protein